MLSSEDEMFVREVAGTTMQQLGIPWVSSVIEAETMTASGSDPDVKLGNSSNPIWPGVTIIASPRPDARHAASPARRKPGTPQARHAPHAHHRPKLSHRKILQWAKAYYEREGR